MSEILQSNIFFFVTAIAVIFVAVASIWVLYHFVRLLRVLRNISEIGEQELYTLRGDVADARAFVKEESIKFKHALGFLSVLFNLGEKMRGRARKPAARKKHSSVINEEKNDEQ